MGRTQCTLKVSRHARVWKFLSLFLPLLALGYIGHSYAAVQYLIPGENNPDVTFSAVPVTGEYIGTTVITQMAQTGDAFNVMPDNRLYSLIDWPSIGYFSGGPVAMRADFTSPVSFVSVDFRPNDEDTGILQVYSAEGVLLGEQVGRGREIFTLSFTASSTPYAYILTTFADSGNLWGVGYEVAAVPEPEAYAMMLAGLGLVGIATRRRKQAEV